MPTTKTTAADHQAKLNDEIAPGARHIAGGVILGRVESHVGDILER